jgi:HK97 family phage major capsid protein
MLDITLLQAELEDIRVKRQDLTAKHQGKTWPAEARQEDSEMFERARKLQAGIAQEEQKERDKYFNNLTDYLDNPVHQIPHPVNADEEGRKAIEKAGWEVKAGMLRVPTSAGKMVDLMPEEVLFGPIPQQDVDAARYFKQMRGAAQPESREAYVTFLRLCAQHKSEAAALHYLTGNQQKALAEGVDSQGGYLVPPDMQAEILVRTAQVSVMRRLARTINTSRDHVIFPRVNAHGTSGSIYSSGFVGGWAGETPAFSETDPVFSQFEISIKKLRVATKLSNDLIGDAITNLPAFLAQNGAENMALVEDQGFIAGLGTSMEPLGILNGGAATKDVEGSTSNTISNTNASAGSAPKIIDLVYALPSQYTRGAEWVMCRAIEGEIRKLVDGQDRYLWPDLSGSGFAPAPRTLMGYPVNNSEFVPDDGSDANKVLIFGDLSNYIIAQRAQISTVILRERFADTDQTGIILFERVGGALWNEDAVRIGIV